MTEEKKRINVVSLALGIVAVIFSLFLPVVAYSCGIPGIVSAIRRKTHNGKAGFALGVTAVSIAAVNSIISILLTTKMFRKAGI
jgi:hypothetical protein